MKLELELAVTLKDGLLDPQGKTVLEALPTMGWSNVSEVRVGKLVRLTLDADDEASGRAQAEEIGRRLLANPVIEDVRVLAVREAV
ncbi:MAG TPA: phosphoribosylformylglycinamidine synthase subunit PurS [Actinomycetota bacterium]